MKKKSMILAVASLGSMAIIGTGFAGWVISADATTTAGGVMTAYEVTDHRLKISDENWTTADAETKKGKIIFGGPTDEKKEGIINPWFTFNEDTEVLENTFSFNVSSNDSKDSRSFAVKAVVTIGDRTKNVWSELATAGYVTETMDTACTPNETNKGTLAGEEGVPCSVVVKFSWGTKFESNNPYVFYNGKDASGHVEGDSGATWADDAKTALTTIYEKMNKLDFKLTITVSATDK